MRAKNRTHEENRMSIFQAVKEAEKPLTRKEIANAIGRKKSPHLSAIADELCEEGHLFRLQDMLANGSIVYLYTLPDRIK